MLCWRAGLVSAVGRLVVEKLSNEGVTILVVHDFDKAGISIVHTLRSDTRRYQFRKTPRVIDLGLRLEDVQEMNLQSETVDYNGKVDPRINLKQSGATDAECAFLVRHRYPWSGERVELNAMTAPQFVAFLERKLDQYGVKKVIPDDKTLAAAYEHASRLAIIQTAIDRATQEIGDSAAPPADLAEQLRRMVDGTDLPWDEALWELVRQQDNTK